jgi:pantothenate kinase
MTNFASSAQFASVFSVANSFLGGGGNPLESGIVAAKGFNNTINRTNLNQAVKALIGNPKITVPDFAPPGTG